MIALLVIMVQELANAIPQRIFSEENHLIQAAFLNSPYEPFGVGIAESRRLQIVWETRRGGSG